jgi:hypothetical protein
MVEFESGGFGEPRSMKGKVVEAEIVPSKLSKREQIHLVFQPADKEWQNQHEWYGISRNKESAFAELTERLRELKVITAKDIKDAETVDELAGIICEKIKGKEFELEEKKIGRKQGFAWFPITLVK